MNNKPTRCPCGSGQALDECCAPLIAGREPAASAEALMRSRYTAYVQMREDYLLATWHAATRPASLDLALDVPPQWLALDVRHHQQQDADHAIVEFVARYKINGRAHRLQETSRFVREHGRWFYLDGDVAD